MHVFKLFSVAFSRGKPHHTTHHKQPPTPLHWHHSHKVVPTGPVGNLWAKSLALLSRADPQEREKKNRGYESVLGLHPGNVLCLQQRPVLSCHDEREGGGVLARFQCHGFGGLAAQPPPCFLGGFLLVSPGGFLLFCCLVVERVLVGNTGHASCSTGTVGRRGYTHACGTASKTLGIFLFSVGGVFYGNCFFACLVLSTSICICTSMQTSIRGRNKEGKRQG